MSISHCNKEGCTAGFLNGNCLESHDTPESECEHYQHSNNQDDEVENAIDEKKLDQTHNQFSSNLDGWGLKADQISLFRGEAQPIVLSLIGLPDVGKTSFLVSLIIGLRMTAPSKCRFMGSYTLKQWGIFIDKATWYGHKKAEYPDPTPPQREPSFLHLMIGLPSEKTPLNIVDVMIGDPSGEWYQSWVEDAENSIHLSSIHNMIDVSDKILFCIDTEALHHPEQCWSYMDQYVTLIDRLGQHFQEKKIQKQIIVIETKSDKLPIKESDFSEAYTRVTGEVKRVLGVAHNYKITSLHLKPSEIPENVMDVFYSSIADEKEAVLDGDTINKNTIEIHQSLGGWLE